MLANEEESIHERRRQAMSAVTSRRAYSFDKPMHIRREKRFLAHAVKYLSRPAMSELVALADSKAV